METIAVLAVLAIRQIAQTRHASLTTSATRTTTFPLATIEMPAYRLAKQRCYRAAIKRFALQ
jgi:hypothetical protein